MKETLIILVLKQFSSIYQIIKYFNINHNILKYWFIENKSITKSHKSIQLFIIPEETTLNQWITQLIISSYSISQVFLQEIIRK